MATYSDVVIFILLLTSVPWLVEHFMRTTRSALQLKNVLTLIGMIWVSYALSLEYVQQVVGQFRSDDYAHEIFATFIMDRIKAGDWNFVLDQVRPGNSIFQVWVALCYYFLDLSMFGCSSFLGWLSFCGNMYLVRHYLNAYPRRGKFSNLHLFLIFLPSTCWWTHLLLKEAVIYWSICVMVASVSPKPGENSPRISLITVIAILAGLSMRPYVLVLWVFSMYGTMLIKQGKLKTFIFGIVSMVLAAYMFHTQMGTNLWEIDAMTERAGKQAEYYATEETTGSKFEYGQESTIFMVSGAISLFLRPFPWNPRSFSGLLASLEIWTLSIAILIGWMRLNGLQRKNLLKRTDIQASLVFLVGFSAMLTYFVNEGLIARMRLQAMPAIILLAIMPIASRIQPSSTQFIKRKSSTLNQYTPNPTVRVLKKQSL